MIYTHDAVDRCYQIVWL